MNKKISLLITILFLLPLNSNASWYGGINLGLNSVNVTKELTYPIDSASPTVARLKSNYTNFHGQLAAGYDFSLNDQFAAAIEGNGDVFTGNSQSTIKNWFFSDDVIAKEKLEYGLGLFVLPSYRLNTNTRLFLGPGISRSKFKISSGVTAGNVGVSGNFSRWLTGGGLKTGITTQLNAAAELSLTYQYTNYQNAQWVNREPISDDSLSGRYKPIVNTVMLGIKVVMPTGNTSSKDK